MEKWKWHQHMFTSSAYPTHFSKKVKAKLSLCFSLTEHHAMKTYSIHSSSRHNFHLKGSTTSTLQTLPLIADLGKINSFWMNRKFHHWDGKRPPFKKLQSRSHFKSHNPVFYTRLSTGLFSWSFPTKIPHVFHTFPEFYMSLQSYADTVSQNRPRRFLAFFFFQNSLLIIIHSISLCSWYKCR